MWRGQTIPGDSVQGLTRRAKQTPVPWGGLVPPGHGACKVVSCGVPLSPQTSNPLELTGRASVVHTLLQKAPGVGGSGVLASLRPGWAFGQHGSTRLTQCPLPTPLGLTACRAWV